MTPGRCRTPPVPATRLWGQGEDKGCLLQDACHKLGQIASDEWVGVGVSGGRREGFGGGGSGGRWVGEMMPDQGCRVCAGSLCPVAVMGQSEALVVVVEVGAGAATEMAPRRSRQWVPSIPSMCFSSVMHRSGEAKSRAQLQGSGLRAFPSAVRNISPAPSPKAWSQGEHSSWATSGMACPMTISQRGQW